MFNLLKLAKKVKSNIKTKTYYFNAKQNTKQQKQTLQQFVNNMDCIVAEDPTCLRLITNNTRLIIDLESKEIILQDITDGMVDDISVTTNIAIVQ